MVKVRCKKSRGFGTLAKRVASTSLLQRSHLSIHIRSAVTMEDVTHCRNLAAQVWGEASACSTAQMSVHTKYGGVLLLAFDDEVPIGFLFSFPAQYEGEWVLWSHETAVLPAYLHQGIGTRLKRAQQTKAAELGYRRIAWTFDPLVSRNAFFNLIKLGATVAEYKVNVYGVDPFDVINQGIETDRFVAVWRTATLTEDMERGKTDGQLLPGSQDSQFSSSEAAAHPYPGTESCWLQVQSDGTPRVDIQRNVHDVVATEIPLNFETLVRDWKQVAQSWRLAFRTVSLELLQEGFIPAQFTVASTNAKYLWIRRQ